MCKLGSERSKGGSDAATIMKCDLPEVEQLYEPNNPELL